MENLDNELSLEMLGSVEDEDLIPQEKGLEDIEENEVTEDELFKNDNPEGVGDESQEHKEDTTKVNKDEGSSPNIYASIANSLKTEGILTLDDSYFKDIKDGYDLAKLFQAQTDLMLDDRQKQISEALGAGLQPDEIKQYQQVMSYLDGITEDSLKDETQDAETLRSNIIFQDFLNRGFTKERAEKEVKKSFDAGTDVEDAIEALQSNKQFYSEQYNTLVEEAKAQKKQLEDSQKAQFKQLEDKFLKTEEPIKGIKLNDTERKKALSQYTRFVAKDSQNRPINELQKYAIENPIDYQYNVSMLFYLTDGFKDLGKALGQEVKNRTKTAMADLEKVIKNPANNLGGSIDFGNSQEPASRKSYNVVFDE